MLVASCAAVAPATLPAFPPLLAVATWNMDAGRGDLPRLLHDLESGRLTAGEAEEFVVLLQEAVADELPLLQRLTDARHWSLLFVPAHYDGTRTRGNAILASRPLLNGRSIALPQERQPRTAAAASFELAGRSLFVVSVHLENRTSWWKGGLFSDAARGRQAEALVGGLPKDTPGILGGDLNTWLGPSEPAWRVLAQRFGDTPAFMHTPTFRGRLVLDHLLYDLPPGWRAAARVSPDTYDSDHHPVVAAIAREQPQY